MTNLPVPNPRTAVAGEFETAAYFNMFRDAINFLANPPLAQLYQVTVQAIPNNAFTPLAFDITSVDSYGGHSNTTNNSRYIAQVAGWYEFDGAVGFAINSTGNRDGAWAKNGTQLTAPGPGSIGDGSAAHAVSLAVPMLQIFMNVGDYVELLAFQSSGAAINVLTGQFGCVMTAKWIHT